MTQLNLLHYQVIILKFNLATYLFVSTFFSYFKYLSYVCIFKQFNSQLLLSDLIKAVDFDIGYGLWDMLNLLSYNDVLTCSL